MLNEYRPEVLEIPLREWRAACKDMWESGHNGVIRLWDVLQAGFFHEWAKERGLDWSKFPTHQRVTTRLVLNRSDLVTKVFGDKAELMASVCTGIPTIEAVLATKHDFKVDMSEPFGHLCECGFLKFDPGAWAKGTFTKVKYVEDGLPDSLRKVLEKRFRPPYEVFLAYIYGHRRKKAAKELLGLNDGLHLLRWVERHGIETVWGTASQMKEAWWCLSPDSVALDLPFYRLHEDRSALTIRDLRLLPLSVRGAMQRDLPADYAGLLWPDPVQELTKRSNPFK